MATTDTIPNRDGGSTPISEASANQLSYWRNRLATELSEGTSRYPDNDRKRLAAIEAELASRSGEAPSSSTAASPAAPAPQRSIQRAATTALQGSYAEAAAATGALQRASADFHLVSPATSCGTLPAGCEVALSLVTVDASENAKETYNLAGRYGLAKVALDKIAGAAGISWDAAQSGRLDDGSDPHYCHYRAVGVVRLFDGQLRTLTGEVEMDARDGSPQIDEITKKAQASRNGPRDPSSQILELRKFLLRHAESKAKNRAIRGLGLKTSYTKDELDKPFAVARVMFTGRTEDPELRRIFAEKTAETFLGAQAHLYGRPAQRAPQLATGHAPPPMALASGGEHFDTEGEEY
jgi:hypothetical protein